MTDDRAYRWWEELPPQDARAGADDPHDDAQSAEPEAAGPVADSAWWDGAPGSMERTEAPPADEAPADDEKPRSAGSRRERRLVALNDAIAVYPEAPSNYVLRGEIYLSAREYALAEADFEQALVLAARQLEGDDWGLVAQATQDRALRGLQRARRKLGYA